MQIDISGEELDRILALARQVREWTNTHLPNYATPFRDWITPALDKVEELLSFIEKVGVQQGMKEDSGICAIATRSLSPLLADKIKDPWVWFLIRNGRVLTAGSEVRSSICWENAERASKVASKVLSKVLKDMRGKEKVAKQAKGKRGKAANG